MKNNPIPIRYKNSVKQYKTMGWFPMNDNPNNDPKLPSFICSIDGTKINTSHCFICMNSLYICIYVPKFYYILFLLF